MKHIYTLLKGILAAVLLGVPSLASAQTLAELAGKWTLTASEVAFGDGSTDGLPASSYDVTITVDEATSTAYLAGFPGTDVTPTDGVFQGTYKSAGMYGYKLTVALPEDSKVTLADGAVVGYSADTDDSPWVVTQNSKTKAITIKQPNGDNLVFSYTKGTTSTTLSFSGVTLTQKTETTPTYTAAPADLAGTYAITTGAVTFAGDTDDITNEPATTYTGIIKVNAKGEATMTGLLGTPMTADYVSGNVIDSCYVGKYDATAQTITFSTPEGYFISVDGEYAYMLLAPFTVKVSKNADGKYVLSTSDAITYDYSGENYDEATCSFAGLTMVQQGENPTYSPAPADLAGTYAISTGDVTFAGDTDDIDTKPATSYTGIIKVNANGEATMTGLIGTPRFESMFDGAVDSCYVGLYDAKAQTITFNTAWGYFCADSEYNVYYLKSAFTVSVAKNDDGKYVLSTSAPIVYTFVGDNKGDATCSFAGLTMTQQAETPTYSPAPADLAGKYTITTGAATFDGDTEYITTVPATTYKGTIKVNANGEATMTGLIGTPMTQSEETMVATDSCYVGKYDAAASTITFSIPDGYFMTDSEYNAWLLKSPFTVSVSKGDDGKYVLSTSAAITYDFWGENEDEATCSFAGLTMTQQPAYNISKEDLIGKWELTFNTLDDESGEAVAADSTMTFTIYEKDGELKVSNVFGSTYEFALNYSDMGVAIPFTSDYIGDDMEMGTQIMICGAYDGLNTPAVSFDFGPDNTLELASMLFCMNENGQFLATSGTAKKVTDVDPEPEPDPEPQALGEAITDLTKLSNDKVYAIYNPVVLGSDTYTSKGAYVVYNPSAVNPTYLWAANGEKGQFNSTAVNFSLTDENHAWMAIQHDGNFYLYNLGTKMFLSTYGWSDAGGASGPCKFSATPTPLTVVTRSDGYLAFTSHESDDHSFLCAAPQFTSYPMSVWTSDDSGSAWALKENANIAPDADAMGLITAIATAKAEAKAAHTGVYTLSGVKMSDTDLTKLPKGVYIVNGKKQIVK